MSAPYAAEALTPAQRRVLGELVQGKDYNEVAATLGLTWHTVKNHADVFHSLFDVHSQAELVARLLGLTPDNPVWQVSVIRAGLKPRQIAVLEGVIRGQSNRQIAHELGMSKSAVVSLLGKLFRRVGARNRTHLLLVLVGQAAPVERSDEA